MRRKHWAPVSNNIQRSNRRWWKTYQKIGINWRHWRYHCKGVTRIT